MTSKKPHILIAEDDQAIAAGLAMNLKIEGYRSTIARDGEEAAAAILDDPPDLILLDISMPKKDGLELLRELRERGDVTLVIVLSARGEETDKVAALRSGADDYVTKPFTLAELMARIAAVLRRSHRQVGESTRRTFGAIRVDVDTRSVTRAGEPVRLTHLEFELLLHFLDHPGRVLSREELLESVWKTRGSPRTVDNFVGQLRAKMEENAEAPRHFVTVRGTGYRFDP